MRVIIFIVISLFLIGGINTQKTKEYSVYQPFTSQQIDSVIGNSHLPIIQDSQNSKSTQKSFKKDKKVGQNNQNELGNNFEDEQLTEEQINQRKQARKTYNKLFRYGFCIGFTFLVVIVVRFYHDKRKRQRIFHGVRPQNRVVNQVDNVSQLSYSNEIDRSLQFHEKQLQRLQAMQRREVQVQQARQRKQYEYQLFKQHMQMHQPIVHRNNHIY